jgi:hypothetical protein
MKELMGMNPLLITVEDFFTMTKAGKHNIKNISGLKPRPVSGSWTSKYSVSSLLLKYIIKDVKTFD